MRKLKFQEIKCWPQIPPQWVRVRIPTLAAWLESQLSSLPACPDLPQFTESSHSLQHSRRRGDCGKPTCVSLLPSPHPPFWSHERKRLKVAPSHLLHQDEWEAFPAIVGMCVDYKSLRRLSAGELVFLFSPHPHPSLPEILQPRQPWHHPGPGPGALSAVCSVLGWRQLPWLISLQRWLFSFIQNCSKCLWRNEKRLSFITEDSNEVWSLITVLGFVVLFLFVGFLKRWWSGSFIWWKYHCSV